MFESMVSSVTLMWQTDGYFDKLHLKLAETEAKLAISQKALDDYHK